MRRYKFLKREDVYEALNRARDAFLAARDGNEVEQIIKGLLTYDERLKIGRRILIFEYLNSGFTIDQIARELKVGKTTVIAVLKNSEEFPMCYELLNKRRTKVSSDYSDKKYKLTGGSTLVFKKKEYTGFKRKDVKR